MFRYIPLLGYIFSGLSLKQHHPFLDKFWNDNNKYQFSEDVLHFFYLINKLHIFYCYYLEQK